MVQWLRCCTPNAGGPGLTPGQGIRYHMPQERSKILHDTTKAGCSQIHICDTASSYTNHQNLQPPSSVQSRPTLCDPMNCSMPGLHVHHQLLEFTQTYVHQVSDAIQPFHPLSSPSSPAPNPSQHQSLFQ